MATREAHIDQAKHNRNFAKQLLQVAPEFRDWAVIAAFYAAVHYVEACFYEVPAIKHSDHRANPHNFRKVELAKCSSKELYLHYNLLFEAAHKARYLQSAMTRSSAVASLRLISTDAARTLIEVDLPTVQELLEKEYHVKLA